VRGIRQWDNGNGIGRIGPAGAKGLAAGLKVCATDTLFIDLADGLKVCATVFFACNTTPAVGPFSFLWLALLLGLGVCGLFTFACITSLSDMLSKRSRMATTHPSTTVQPSQLLPLFEAFHDAFACPLVVSAFLETFCSLPN
jgi:hypothetical protein